MKHEKNHQVLQATAGQGGFTPNEEGRFSIKLLDPDRVRPNGSGGALAICEKFHLLTDSRKPSE
jgi:hypothetical protein